MTDQDRESAGMTPNPVPVTPSENTERPEGLAFDVEDSAAARRPARAGRQQRVDRLPSPAGEFRHQVQVGQAHCQVWLSCR